MHKDPLSWRAFAHSRGGGLRGSVLHTNGPLRFDSSALHHLNGLIISGEVDVAQNRTADQAAYPQTSHSLSRAGTCRASPANSTVEDSAQFSFFSHNSGAFPAFGTPFAHTVAAPDDFFINGLVTFGFGSESIQLAESLPPTAPVPGPIAGAG